ncbi:MAG: hypothetical protein PHE25_04435 [Candidatus Gracilibacteria bacterium]|nr:hypothetical protein [Candidatus Gracilibacteria bacterium]
MRLYRFSPISSKEELIEAIKHIHIYSYILCKSSFGEYLENSGNIGIFCHYEEEFTFLKSIREEITFSSENPNQKYFELKSPIIIEKLGDIPEGIYTHIYIRKPDPYRHYVGDLDFYLDEEIYDNTKKFLLQGNKIKNARLFDRPDLDMIELYNPDIDALAYVSTQKMTKIVRIKQSDITKL